MFTAHCRYKCVLQSIPFLTGALETWTRVFMAAQWALYPLSHLSSLQLCFKRKAIHNRLESLLMWKKQVIRKTYFIQYISYLSLFKCYLVCVCARVRECVCARMPQNTRGGQRITCGKRSSPSTIWVLGISRLGSRHLHLWAISLALLWVLNIFLFSGLFTYSEFLSLTLTSKLY